MTDDGKAIVDHRRCGASLCGTINEVLDRSPGVPATDIRNPTAALRTRSIVGLPILFGFRRRNGHWIDGTAYDPKSGRSYRASLDVKGTDRLKVTGCVLFICQTKTWTRRP